MYLSGIVYESVVDGEGIRNVLFISGCRHQCKNCQNPKTWSFSYGTPFTLDKQMSFIKECQSNPLLDGITISGGDPFYSSCELVDFVKLYKQYNPDHTIWIYSGFTYEEIQQNPKMKELLSECDVLVDGLYVEELRYPQPRFRGSNNQRIIYLKEE